MSNQYSSSAAGSAGGDGQEELDQLRRQAEAQAHQIRELKAEEPFNNMRQALLRAAIMTMLQFNLDEEAKAKLEGVIDVVDKMYEDQGYTATLDTIKGQEELLMRMSVPELKDFINKLVPQATTEAGGSIEG